MKYKCQILLFLILTITGSDSLFAQWLPTNGPNGHEVNAVAVEGNKLYVGGKNFNDGCLYRYTKQDGIWTAPVNICPLYEDGCSAIAVKDSIVITNSGYGYRSTDYGTTWDPFGSDLNFPSIRALLFKNSKLVAGTSQGVYFSNDNGETWEQRNTGLTSMDIRCLAVCGHYLIAGSTNGLFITADNGKNWIRQDTGLPFKAIYSLCVNGPNIIAGTEYYIYISTDTAKSWSPSGNNLPDMMVASLGASGSNLFIGTIGGVIYRSTDNGLVWTQVNNDLTWGHIYTLQSIDSTIYAGTDQGMFLSADEGSTWTLTGFPVPVLALTTIGSTLVAGTTQGISLSWDNAASWGANNPLQPLHPPNGTFTKVDALVSWNGRVYEGSGNEGHVSNDSGRTWTVFGYWGTTCFAVTDKYLFSCNYGRVNCISYDGHSGDLNTPPGREVDALTSTSTGLYAGGYLSGVYRSTDYGVSWTEARNGLTDLSVITLAGIGPYIFAGTNSGVFRSTNSGDDWMQANSGLTDTSVRTFATSGVNLYAGTAGGVFLSNDYGESWMQIDTGLTGVNAVSVSVPYIFAGTNSGVRRDLLAFSASPSILSFGNVLVNGTTTDTVTVTNYGLSTLNISSVTSNHPQFIVTPVSGSIAPGGNAIFNITYSPTSMGTERGAISFVHGTQGSPGRISVTGVGIQAIFSDSPSVVLFGNVPVNSNKKDSVVVTNSGTSTLTISLATSSSSKFSVLPETCDIAPTLSKTFYITYHPTGMGSDSGVILMTHNGRGLRDSISVKGTGVLTDDLQTGWNMVSIPLIPDNYAMTALFPGAISEAYAYGGSYFSAETLKNGTGYWVRVSGGQRVPFTGSFLAVDTIEVANGWNMIGSISAPVPVSSITSIPGGFVTSQFFAFENGYSAVTSIQPGAGYWVKVSQEGKLVLSSTGSMTPSNASRAIHIVLTNELPPEGPGGKPELKELPKVFALDNAYPSPFNPSTRLQYALPVDSKVRLTIYNPLGQVIAKPVNGVETAGYKSVEWNASSFSSGVYFYRLEATGTSDAGKTFTSVKKMVLIK